MIIRRQNKVTNKDGMNKKAGKKRPDKPKGLPPKAMSMPPRSVDVFVHNNKSKLTEIEERLAKLERALERGKAELELIKDIRKERDRKK